MTDKPTPNMMPPVPRDHDDASFSEMVPFRSSKIRLAKSPLMLFGIVTAVAVPFLFYLLDQQLGPQQGSPQELFESFKMIAKISVFFILMLMMIALFTYSRSNRPLWVFAIAFVAIATITWQPFLFQPLVWPFREIIPNIGPMAFDQTSFVNKFFGMLFVAGLAEEWVKAIPILIGAWLTWRVMAGKMPDTGFTAKFRIRGPLDGVLMGLFAGAGFIMAETGGQYVENMFFDVVKQTGSYDAGVAAALLLLLPRTFSGVIMHMGWSAIFGYFIGLAAIRPKARWKLIAIGYVTASVTHALWNSHFILSDYIGYVVAIATAVMAVGCLLKARQMELAASGPPPETFGSIIVERPRAAPPAMPAAAPAYVPPTPAAMPPGMPAQAPAVAEALALDVDGLTIPLRGGGIVDLGAEPALGGRGAGVIGAIVPHPSRANVLGLRNAGGGPWTARLRDGSQQVIDRDQNIRLAAGVQIDFGGGLTGRVVKIA